MNKGISVIKLSIFLIYFVLFFLVCLPYAPSQAVFYSIQNPHELISDPALVWKKARALSLILFFHEKGLVDPFEVTRGAAAGRLAFFHADAVDQNIAKLKKETARFLKESANAVNYEALERYQKLLQQYPEYEDFIRYHIGYIYLYAGKYDAALIEFDKTIALNKYFYDAYQNRAVLFRLTKDYRRSVEALDVLIKMLPCWSKPYCSQGHAYELLGEYEQAVVSLLEAIKSAPHWKYPRARLHQCLPYISSPDTIQNIIDTLTAVRNQN